jgi:nucleotide-binding universal stress UspA family protein
MKMLVAVDGSDGAAKAVAHVVRIAPFVTGLQVQLVTVCASLDTWEVGRFMTREDVMGWQRESAEAAFSPARTLLDAGGVPYTTHILTGPVAERIVEEAATQGCDCIVMGTRGLGPLEGLLVGSVAGKVIALSDVPVTLVK